VVVTIMVVCDGLTREAAGLIGKALWPDAGKLQPQLQPEAGS
jgi:hypothetical protein